MTLKDVLDVKGRLVYSVRPEQTVLEAVHVLVSHNIGSVAVCDDQERLVGILTERDILRLCVANRVHLSSLVTRDVMTRDLHTGSSTTSIDDALTIMTENRVRHFPVIEKDRLVGMISQGDLVKAKLGEAQFEAQQLVNLVSGKYPA